MNDSRSGKRQSALYAACLHITRPSARSVRQMTSQLPLFPGPDSTAELEEGRTLTPKFDTAGLIAGIVTDAATGDVLMFAWLNDEALARSIESGIAHFWSRSRRKLWKKGEDSGNVLRITEMRTDCDQDVVWMKVSVDGHGAACHTGRHSCFYRQIPVGGRADAAMSFTEDEPRFDPTLVYDKPKT